MTIEVIIFLQGLRNGFLDVFFNMVSFLGEESLYMLVLAVVYFTISKKHGELLAFTLLFTGLFNNTLKGIVNAQRPFQKYPDDVTNLRPETSTGQSFPSGHTQHFSAFLFTGSFILKKKYAYMTALVLTVLMAISRMYLGVHFLEDVSVALLLGFLTAYLFSRFFYKLDDKNLMKVYITILIVFLPFLFLNNGEDLFKSYGMFSGFVLAMFIEKKYISFEIHNNISKNVLRVALALIVMLAVQMGLKVFFSMFAELETSSMNIFNMIRYFFIAFIGLGCYPILFKKFNF
jgi:membrane-associated phospholipid phosphatase